MVQGGYWGFDGGDEPIEEVTVTAPRPKKKDPFVGFAELPRGVDDFGAVLEEVVVEAARDYCGNKYFNAPDIVRESCKQHDKDYSKDSELSRKEADDRFLENMKKELAEKYPDMPQWVRDSIANTYYKAVRENGHVSYEGKGENDRVVNEGDGIPRVPRF